MGETTHSSCSTTERAVNGLAPAPFVVIATAAGRRLQMIGSALVVPESVDELALVHLGTSLDADLFRTLLQILLRPVLVAARLPAALACPRATGVGDPRRLLLALPFLSQLLVLLVILDGWPVILGPAASSSSIRHCVRISITVCPSLLNVQLQAADRTLKLSLIACAEWE